jgi:aspartyl protease family protein
VKIPPIVWILVGGGALLTLVVFLAMEFPGSLSDRDSQVSLTYSLLLLVMIGGSALVGRRFKNVPVVRYAALWIVLGLGIFALYSFRDEAGSVYDRLVGELVPGRAQTEGDNVVVRMASNGHFIVRADIDGTVITFLVDTGATDVVLSPADAKRLGFDLDTLKFTKTYRTANGTVRGAPVHFNRMSIGPLVLHDVRASVNSADMGRSLLGMSFLDRLSGYEVRGNSLILKP